MQTQHTSYFEGATGDDIEDVKYSIAIPKGGGRISIFMYTKNRGALSATFKWKNRIRQVDLSEVPNTYMEAHLDFSPMPLKYQVEIGVQYDTMGTLWDPPRATEHRRVFGGPVDGNNLEWLTFLVRCARLNVTARIAKFAYCLQSCSSPFVNANRTLAPSHSVCLKCAKPAVMLLIPCRCIVLCHQCCEIQNMCPNCASRIEDSQQVFN